MTSFFSSSYESKSDIILPLYSYDFDSFSSRFLIGICNVFLGASI
jgi:hypothetical protein